VTDREKTREEELEERWRRTHRMLDAIRKAQDDFIFDADRRSVFDSLLSALLSAADSEYGFIGETRSTDAGQPYLKTYAITNIAWDEATRRLYEEKAPAGLEFHNLKSLFGEVLVTGKAVISNDAPRDPRRTGTPPGHPPLLAFLGLPLYRNERMIGMVGLSNRPGGYDDEVVETLQPLLATCANLIEAYQRDQSRVASEQRARAYAEEVERKNALLEQEIEQRRRTEEVLRRQREAITALSAPIIQVWEGVIAMPIIGFIDSARAAQMMEKLLADIVRLGARYAILDLTGVDTVDTAVASHLLGMARAAGLLGSVCVLSGISPHVAQIMVGLGIDAQGFASFSTLQAALKHAIEQTMAAPRARPLSGGV